MTVKFRLLACLGALSALLVTGAPVQAGLLGVELFVNGESVGGQTAEPDADGAVPIAFDAAQPGFQIEGLAILDADPFISFSLTALNFSDDPLSFAFVFSSPYLLGPYNTLLSEFSSTVTDADQDGGASAAPTDLSGLVSIPQIDGANISGAALGTGCSLVMVPGSTDTCDPFSSASVSVVTLANGTFGVALAFMLSGGDSFTADGRVELTNTQIPEPATIVLLGLGVSIAAVRRRQSHRGRSPV